MAAEISTAPGGSFKKVPVFGTTKQKAARLCASANAQYGTDTHEVHGFLWANVNAGQASWGVMRRADRRFVPISYRDREQF